MNPTENRLKVLLCDDHEIFRAGLSNTLQSIESLEVCGESENGQACLDFVSENEVDIIFLDINMPVMDGIECLQILKEKHSSIKVLALTQYDEHRFVKQMLKYGADGYILKSAGKHEILKAISAVKNGRVYLTQEAEAKVEGLKTAEEPNALFPQLSDRELEIIKLLCHEYNTKQIAETVHLSTHTIESHRSNIFKKVGVANVAGLVRWAVNNGLD